VDAVIGLRVEPEDEAVGLDVSQHGESADNESGKISVLLLTADRLNLGAFRKSPFLP
jgi:hypothetical protein